MGGILEKVWWMSFPGGANKLLKTITINIFVRSRAGDSTLGGFPKLIFLSPLFVIISIICHQKWYQICCHHHHHTSHQSCPGQCQHYYYYCSIFVLFSPISCCWKSWHHKRGNLCRPRSSSITWAIADQINIIQRYSTICPTPSQWQIFQGKIVIIANCCTFFYPSAPFWEIRTKLSRHQPIYHRSRPKLLILWRTVIFVVDFK